MIKEKGIFSLHPHEMYIYTLRVPTNIETLSASLNCAISSSGSLIHMVGTYYIISTIIRSDSYTQKIQILINVSVDDSVQSMEYGVIITRIHTDRARSKSRMIAEV